jgi:hypothetical protein
MNLMAISKAIGGVLFDKGVIGHVTIDLVSFPDPVALANPDQYKG